MLPEPSNEQQLICDALSDGHNVIVNAVAGAGKTTTVLLSMKNHDKPSLLLTYNRLLKESTRVDAIKNCINNLEVHSYNSFGVAYINDSCCTDAGFLDDYEIDNVPQYSRIYIDEIQDCTYMYYTLIKKLLDTQDNPQLCVLGDCRQTIFAFKGANSKYLTLADKIFKSDRQWDRLTLKTSYRLTVPMAECMNECVLHENKFESIKPGPPVSIRIMRPENVHKVVRQLLSQPGVNPSDIFILSYSTKASYIMTSIENSLKDIPRIVLNDDAGVIDETVTNGKLVISSFHKVKGLGRPKVIVLGFDEGYYYSDRTADMTKCSNPLYVGLSRSTNELILIHDIRNESFSWFIPNDKLIVIGQKIPKPFKKTPGNYNISVRDFIKFIDPVYERKIRKLITYETISNGVKFNIPTTVPGITHQDITLVEEVAEITGIAIPAYAQYKLHGVMQIYASLVSQDKYGADTFFQPIQHYTTSDKLLKLAMYYWTMRSKYKYRKEQLANYNWLPQEDLDVITDRLINIIDDPSAVFECEGAIQLDEFGMSAKLVGFADCISNKDIIEIKCTSELSFEHQLQLVVYACIFNRNGTVRNLKLVNALTGEVQTVVCSDYHKLMKLLTKNKQRIDEINIDDEAFIEMHND